MYNNVYIKIGTINFICSMLLTIVPNKHCLEHNSHYWCSFESNSFMYVKIIKADFYKHTTKLWTLLIIINYKWTFTNLLFISYLLPNNCSFCLYIFYIFHKIILMYSYITLWCIQIVKGNNAFVTYIYIYIYKFVFWSHYCVIVKFVSMKSQSIIIIIFDII